MTGHAQQLIAGKHPFKLTGYWECPDFVYPVRIESDNGSELLVRMPTGNILPCGRDWFLSKFKKCKRK